MDKLPNVWLFWTGWEKYHEWWSGIENILEIFWAYDIKDRVSVIVSDNWNGGVRKKAYNNWIPFHYFDNFPKRWEGWNFSELDLSRIENKYKEIVEKYDLEYVFMSWWLKYILWLTPNKTVNIHPGPVEEPYGWKWMYWDNIHKKVWEDYTNWTINQTCVTMHFVNEKFDDGPIIIQLPVWMVWCNSWEDVKERVNNIEHLIQWKITLLIMQWEISWSWVEWEPVQFPEGFLYWEKLDLMWGTPYDNTEKIINL